MPKRSLVSIFGLNFPPEPSGIAPYTGALASGLENAGYCVTAHVAHPHYPEWVVRETYGQWTRSEQFGGVRVLRRLHFVPRSPRGARRLVSEVTFGSRLIMAGWKRPTVIIAVSPSLFSTAMVALRARLTPNRPRFIIWVQDLYSLGMIETGEGSRVARSITRSVESCVLRAADRVVVIHERFADFVVDELKVQRPRVVVIRNWTHLAPSTCVEATSAKAALGWPKDVRLAVHTGNMGAKQGLENVVEAARLADERAVPIHFILVGNGGERRDLEMRAKGISRITFVDSLDDERYRQALGAADVLIVNEKPGVSAMAVPSKLTSYFDAGRPVVAATDPNGITAGEVAAANAGVVVNAGDPAALLDAVISIVEDPETADRLARNGRRYREVVLDQHEALRQWARVVESVSSGGRP